MLAKYWSRRIVDDLRGAWTRLALIKAKANRAFVAQNVRFPPGRVITRDGLVNRLAVAAQTTALYNWVTPLFNSLVYLEGTSLKILNIGTAAITTIAAIIGARAFVAAESGTRLYLAFYNTASAGATQAKVVNTSIFGSPADNAFGGPAQVTAITLADGAAAAAGGATAGLHYAGIILQSRSGFAGLPGPVNGGGVFTPVSYTASGAKKAHLAVTMNTPSDASLAYPIFTRSDNPNIYYFVPIGVNGGAAVGLPPSTPAFSFSWDIDIVDADLASLATVATPNFSLVAQDTSGNGPFTPSAVHQYGQRMVYIAGTDVWISDVNNAQSLDAAGNKVQVPGVRQIITALVIRGVLYLIGPGWTYSTTDRTGKPNTWQPPQLISGALGTRAPRGVTDKTAGDYGWVATEDGLYQFSGRYAAQPITYLSAEWGTINWAAASALQIADDFVNQKIYVAAPFGSQTEPSQMLVIDYAKGMTPYDVDISIDTFNPSFFPGGLCSAIEVVNDAPDNRTVLFIAPAVAGQIVKPLAGQKSDQGAAIDSIYETGRILDEGDSFQSSRLGRLQGTIKGSGTLSITAYSQDRTKSASAPATTLSATPDTDVDQLIDLSDVDNFSIRFRVNAVGDWMDISRLRPWWRAMWQNR